MPYDACDMYSKFSISSPLVQACPFGSIARKPWPIEPSIKQNATTGARINLLDDVASEFTCQAIIMMITTEALDDESGSPGFSALQTVLFANSLPLTS